MSNPSVSSGPLQELEQNVTSALECRPDVRLPEGFAARVSALAAAMPLTRQKRSISYGRITAAACAAMLLVAMFVLATQAKASFTSLAFDLELLLLLQLVGIAWWLAASMLPHDA